MTGLEGQDSAIELHPHIGALRFELLKYHEPLQATQFYRFGFRQSQFHGTALRQEPWHKPQWYLMRLDYTNDHLPCQIARYTFAPYPSQIQDNLTAADFNGWKTMERINLLLLRRQNSRNPLFIVE